MLMTASFVPNSISYISLDAIKLAKTDVDSVKTEEKVPAPIIDPLVLSEIADDESLEMKERITLKTKLVSSQNPLDLRWPKFSRRSEGKKRKSDLLSSNRPF